jgi:hypothetical protein
MSSSGFLNIAIPKEARIYCNQYILIGEPKSTTKRYLLKEMGVNPINISKNLKGTKGTALKIKRLKKLLLFSKIF